MMYNALQEAIDGKQYSKLTRYLFDTLFDNNIIDLISEPEIVNNHYVSVRFDGDLSIELDDEGDIIIPGDLLYEEYMIEMSEIMYRNHPDDFEDTTNDVDDIIDDTIDHLQMGCPPCKEDYLRLSQKLQMRALHYLQDYAEEIAMKIESLLSDPINYIDYQDPDCVKVRVECIKLNDADDIIETVKISISYNLVIPLELEDISIVQFTLQDVGSHHLNRISGIFDYIEHQDPEKSVVYSRLFNYLLLTQSGISKNCIEDYIGYLLIHNYENGVKDQFIHISNNISKSDEIVMNQISRIHDLVYLTNKYMKTRDVTYPEIRVAQKRNSN